LFLSAGDEPSDAVVLCGEAQRQAGRVLPERRLRAPSALPGRQDAVWVGFGFEPRHERGMAGYAAPWLAGRCRAVPRSIAIRVCGHGPEPDALVNGVVLRMAIAASSSSMGWTSPGWAGLVAGGLATAGCDVVVNVGADGCQRVVSRDVPSALGDLGVGVRPAVW